MRDARRRPRSRPNPLSGGRLSLPPAPAALVPTLGAPAYADDFETPGPLAGRANWSTSGPGLAASGGSAGNTVQYGPERAASFGPSWTGDFTATWHYRIYDPDPDGTPWEGFRQHLTMWGGSAALVAAGDRVSVTGYNYTLAQPAPPQGELRVESRGGYVSVWLDGLRLTANDGAAGDYQFPFDRILASRLVPDPAARQGPVGFVAGTYRWPVLDAIEASPLYVTLDPVPAFAPRGGKTSTSGAVPLSGSYGGGKTPASGLYRVRESASDAVVQDWRPMTGFSHGSGTWSGAGSVPVGGPYTLDAGYTDDAGVSWVAASEDVLCGALIACYGQSNAAGRFADAPAGYVASSRAANTSFPGAGTPRGTWSSRQLVEAGRYRYSAARETAERLSALLGVPVGAAVAGVGGTGIGPLAGDGWAQPGGWGFEAAYWGGAVECVVWDQGENDADGAFPPTYYADVFLDTLLPRLRSDTGNPTLPVLIDPVGRFADAGPPGGDPGGSTRDAYRDVLQRQYQAIVAADPNVHFGASKLGVPHSDAYHYPAAGYVEVCRRDAWSIAKHVYGIATHDGRGPLVTGAARSGAVLTLTVDLNGATGLTGPTALATGTVPAQPAGRLYGYDVSADDFATLLTVSSLAVSGAALVLTLAADPGGPVKVRSMYGWSYDDTTLVYGAYADTGPIPVWPVVTPLSTG